MKKIETGNVIKESYNTEEKHQYSAQPNNIIRKRSHVKDFTRVISFTSGKGGVGKTNLSTNLGVALCQRGNRVLLLDADLGLANVDILLGISPKYNLYDVLAGRKTIDEIIVDGPEGLSIIPAASGIESVCELSTSDKLHLIGAIENISTSYDYLLIDTRAGVSSDVMYFNSASNEIFVVINNEPTSLTDAYAVIKVLSKNYGEKTFSVISNDVRDSSEGAFAFQRLQHAVEKFLQVKLDYLGYVPTDSMLNEAIQEQKPLVQLFPTSKAAMAIGGLAKKIDEEGYEFRMKGGMQFFFRQLLDVESAKVL